MSEVMAEFPVTHIIRELSRDKLLPAILFRTSRKQCDGDVERLCRTVRYHLAPTDQERIKTQVDRVIAKYNIDPSFVVNYPHYQALVTCGVGAHHAGQLLMWRLMLEELMSAGVLRMMVATGTVAAGVDFPARTVVITAHSKRGSEGFSVLSPAELQQMAGRAGRRGKDSVGLCLVAPSQFSDARVIHEVSKRPPDPLRSQYFASPSTVLNLLKYRNVDDLQYTVARSLAAFLDRKGADEFRRNAATMHEDLEQQMLKGEAQKKGEKRVRRLQRDADELEQRQEHNLKISLEGLRALGYVSGGSLTDKGYWAAELCTSLVLELGECVADGVFDDSPVYELVAMIGSIAGDPHRPYFNLRQNPIPRERFAEMELRVNRVKEAYVGARSSEVQVLPDASLTVLTWLESETWPEFASLLRLSGVADGDAARVITQTADHLNQISRLHKSHKILADVAKEGRKRLLRPPFSDAVLE